MKRILLLLLLMAFSSSLFAHPPVAPSRWKSKVTRDTTFVLGAGGDTLAILTYNQTTDTTKWRASITAGRPLQIKVDVLDISGDLIKDFAGSNLSVDASGILNASTSAGLWDSTAVVNIDSFFVVGRNADTAMFITMDTLQDTISIDFGQSESQVVRIRNVNRVDSDTVTVNAVPITDFEGTNLSVTAGVLNSTSGARWVNKNDADTIIALGIAAGDTLLLINRNSTNSASLLRPDASSSLRIEVDTVDVTGAGSGRIRIEGLTSGSATLGVSAIAGTPDTILLPSDNSANLEFLMSNGANPAVTTWELLDSTKIADGDLSLDDLALNWELANSTDDTMRWISPGLDTALIIATDDATDDVRIQTGQADDASAMSLSILLDTMIINSVPIIDFEGTNLSVTAGVLNAAGGGAGLWDSTAVVNIDSFYVVGRNNDTAMFIVMDTLQDTISVDFGQSEGQTVRIRNVDRGDIDTLDISGDILTDITTTDVTVTAGALLVVNDGHDHTTTTVSGLLDANMANDALDPDKLVGDAVDNDLVDHDIGGLELDVSGFVDGLYGMASSVTIDIDTKAELEAAISDVADFAEADGDAYTGAHDYVGATFKFPAVNNPTVDTIAEASFDANNFALEFFDGTNSYLTAQQAKFMIIPVDNPDGLTNDSVTILILRAEKFPFGIELIGWGFELGATATAYTVNMEHWTDPNTAVGTETNVDASIATSSGFVAEDDGSFTSGSIAVGSRLVALLPDDDIDKITFWLAFYINDGD